MPEFIGDFINILKNKKIAMRMMTKNQRRMYGIMTGIMAPLSLICLFLAFHGHFLLGLLGFAAFGIALSQADEIALMLKNQGERIYSGECTLERFASEISRRVPNGWRMEQHPNELLFLHKQSGRIMSVRHGGNYMYLQYSDPGPRDPAPEAFEEVRQQAENIISYNWITLQ